MAVALARLRARAETWLGPQIAELLTCSSSQEFSGQQTVDPRFAERLAGELNALGVKLDDDLFFICRSGGRSLTAAKAMAAMGYCACHNVAGGFEGPLDDERHRGTAGGWQAAGLPWLQG